MFVTKFTHLPLQITAIIDNEMLCSTLHDSSSIFFWIRNAKWITIYCWLCLLAAFMRRLFHNFWDSMCASVIFCTKGHIRRIAMEKYTQLTFDVFIFRILIIDVMRLISSLWRFTKTIDGFDAVEIFFWISHRNESNDMDPSIPKNLSQISLKHGKWNYEHLNKWFHNFKIPIRMYKVENIARLQPMNERTKSTKCHSKLSQSVNKHIHVYFRCNSPRFNFRPTVSSFCKLNLVICQIYFISIDHRQ